MKSRLCEQQSTSKNFGEIILPLPGIEPKSLERPFRNLVAVQAKLSMDKEKHKRNKEVKEESN